MTPTELTVAVNWDFVDKLRGGDPRWEVQTTTFSNAVLSIEALAEVIARGHPICAALSGRRDREHFVSSQILGLDMDTNDGRSALPALLKIPLIERYGTIVHTSSNHTPEAPRAHVLFVLDQPIVDADRYARLAEALVAFFGLADRRASDAARQWFGAKDCEMVVRPGCILPLAVVEALAPPPSQAAVAVRREAKQDVTPDMWVKWAILRTRHAYRNDTGYWLANRLLESGIPMPEAEAAMLAYQQAVVALRTPLYTQSEARASLRSAARRAAQPHRRAYPAREAAQARLEQDLARFWASAWEVCRGRAFGSPGNLLKTAQAVAQIAWAVGRTEQLALSVRTFAKVGITRSSASRHLRALVRLGLLTLEGRAGRSCAASYSLRVPPGAQTAEGGPATAWEAPGWDNELPGGVQSCPSVGGADAAEGQVAALPTYRGLQTLAHFCHAARIDPALWAGEPPAESFGPSLQRLLAVMAEMEPPTVSLLCRWAGVGESTARRKLRLLRDLDLVWEEVQPDARSRRATAGGGLVRSAHPPGAGADNLCAERQVGRAV